MGSLGSSCRGIQICVSAFGKRKPAGMTPMISVALPDTNIFLPITDRSAAYRLRHKPSLMRTTLGPLGRSSLSLNVRPTIGDTPSSGMRFDEAHAAVIRSGSARPSGSVTLAEPSSYSATPSTVCAYRLYVKCVPAVCWA